MRRINGLKDPTTNNYNLPGFTSEGQIIDIISLSAFSHLDECSFELDVACMLAVDKFEKGIAFTKNVVVMTFKISRPFANDTFRINFAAYTKFRN